MHGGEIFVPKLPSMNIMELARAVAPDCQVEEVGARPGERLHEVLLQEEESRHTVELDDLFVIKPAHPWWTRMPGAKGGRWPTAFATRATQRPMAFGRRPASFHGRIVVRTALEQLAIEGGLPVRQIPVALWPAVRWTTTIWPP